MLFGVLMLVVLSQLHCFLIVKEEESVEMSSERLVVQTAQV